jgi:glutaconyl-CoA/methylmalonyl-CoA decarboxylase subunit delta
MVAASISFDFSQISGFGVTLAVVGYVTVFVVLALLYVVFSNIPKIIRLNVRKKLIRAGKIKEAMQEDINMVGEENAAIGMALHLFLNEAHDIEDTVLTIKNIRKEYSPWSSKIYNINQLHHKIG